jgi:predicted ATPase/class 3 adenylate cyclase
VETFTFLFTDIEGSTALVRRLGEGLYAQLLAGHHALIRSALAAHDGREVNTQGDAFFAVFSSPRACVAAVLEMQQALQAHPWPGGAQVRVRAGIHTGEAEKTATGLVGVEVHRAARVAAAGYGGQVLLSETVAALVRDALPPGASLKDLGAHRLKDLGRPERIFQLVAVGLPAEFPPLRSLGHPSLPNNLPAQLAAFIGRNREMAEVRALVTSSRLVTLTGAGGCGKTRLALQVAAELLDGSGDGVWLVELAAVTGEQAVAPAICQALRIAAQPGPPAMDTLLDALAPQDVLIVLDNCEHLIDGCAKTADAIARRCPRVRLVATSREPLGIGGETIYRVPSLSLPESGDDPLMAASSDAVALLVERAKEQGVDLSLDQRTGPLVASICARLDGMPLAIELAAARLRSLSLADVAARLDQRFRLLSGGSRTAPGRQRTLEAAVGWSYALLNRAEQSLLQRLAVFAESFDLDAAEGACGFGGIEAADVTDLIGLLVDKSLVVAVPAGDALRYRLLETIRQFAADRLAESGHDETDAAQAAHCAHYLSVAETTAPHLTGPDQGSWLARLNADQANLRRAAEHAASRPDGTALVLRFGIALRRYWQTRDRNDEAALLVGVLRRPQAAADPALFAEALTAAAELTQESDLATSLHLAQQADQVARALGDNRLLVLTCQALCWTYGIATERERARQLGQESVQRARALGDDVLLGQSLFVYASTAPAPECWPLYAEALACTERTGDLFFTSGIHNNAGFTALAAGDIPAARAHLEAAIQAAEALGVPSLAALGNLAEVLRAEHDLDGARSGFEDVVRMARRTGDRYALAGALLGLGCLAADLGEWRRAAVLYGAEHALADQVGYRWSPFDARRRQESLDQARAALGDEPLQQAYAYGRALSFDQAIDLALGESLPAT